MCGKILQPVRAPADRADHDEIADQRSDEWHFGDSARFPTVYLQDDRPCGKENRSSQSGSQHWFDDLIQPAKKFCFETFKARKQHSASRYSVRPDTS